MLMGENSLAFNAKERKIITNWSVLWNVFALLPLKCLDLIECTIDKYVISMKIDSCSQFHQCYTRAFFLWIFQQSQNVTRKKDICTKKAREKRWWNWYLKAFFPTQSMNWICHPCWNDLQRKTYSVNWGFGRA